MIVRRLVERLVAGIKRDPGYELGAEFTDAQLTIVLWHRTWQFIRGMPLRARARGVRGTVFRGRRVVVEHARQLSSEAGLILEDGVFVNALSRDGVRLGRNVTLARGATIVCTGVLTRLGVGVRIGDRCGIGAGCFLGGQGGLAIGDDVIIGPGARIFSENHLYSSLDRPIRAQGESRRGTSVGSDCWIGAGATIVDGVDIGSGSVVAAGAVVTRSVPPLSVAAGVPARVIRSRQPGEVPSAPDLDWAPEPIGLRGPVARGTPQVQ